MVTFVLKLLIIFLLPLYEYNKCHPQRTATINTMFYYLVLEISAIQYYRTDLTIKPVIPITVSSLLLFPYPATTSSMSPSG